MRNLLTTLALAALISPLALWADAGILIPSNDSQPDPKKLSLEEMDIAIRIDNGVARVSIRQIFASHQSGVLEGKWIFALPNSATVSDFAVWDGVTRIPGVILERKRAGEIYDNITRQMIDPGLLQMGEYGAEEAKRGAVFSAKVFPIPGYGFKRVEVEYHQRVPVENLRSYFAVPLRPDAYRAQVAGRLGVTLDITSQHPMSDFRFIGDTYSLEVSEQTPHKITASFEGSDIAFNEDFAVEYTLDPSRGDILEILTHRDPSARQTDPGAESPQPATDEPGFFQASALLTAASTNNAIEGPSLGPPRKIVVLFDQSLSMQWGKLDRAFQSLETLLHGLKPNDSFNLLLFHTKVSKLFGAASPVTPEQIEQALRFVRSSYIQGGTNMRQALAAGLDQFSTGTPTGTTPEPYLVLLTDGGATRGPIKTATIASWFTKQLEEMDSVRRPRVFTFAIGDDANLPLLRLLSGSRGVIEHVRSTEPVDFKLNAFLSKFGRNPIDGLRLATEPAPLFDLIYPLQQTLFAGSIASWIGRYTRPAAEASFAVSGQRRGEAFTLEATAELPEQNLAHPHLPRTWARARVDALLEKLERDGEDQATIDEIIRLAKKYKFVTLYTSFLAAPRALLRPRVIRPGDPLLRVRTDESIVSVTALFPFGLVKKLRYLEDEDIYQTRFLAPKNMTDGKHEVRLILRGRDGHVYRESKSFLIASKPPVVRVHLTKKQFRRGETVELRVAASRSTRTLVARMYGIAPVSLRWNPEARYNTGAFVIPASLPAGTYPLKLIAEDFAHNIGTAEVLLEVVP